MVLFQSLWLLLDFNCFSEMSLLLSSFPVKRFHAFSNAVYNFAHTFQGFCKIDGDRWEFANEEFLRGKRKLLKNITRRKSPRTQPKSSQFGSSMGMELLVAEDEVQKLRSEKHLLMQEVVKLKQEHLETIKEMDELNCRLQSAELKQKQMMSFWAKVLQNSVFLMKLKQTKKLREIASTRSIKRSLEQAQPGNSLVNKSITQQIVKYGQNFCEPGSTFVLHGLESNSETALTDHLLHDVRVQNGSSNKRLEILEPSFSPNAASKGKNILISEKDANLDSDDFYISSPEEFLSNKMVVEPISPSGKSSTHKVLQIDTFNGQSVGNVFQDPVLLYSVKPGDEIGCKEEFYDVDFESGGSFASVHDVWNNIFCTNPVIHGDEMGLSEMWDFGLQCDEGFDIDKCFGGEFPLLPDMDEDGLGDNFPKDSGP